MNAHSSLHRRHFVAAVLSGIGLVALRSLSWSDGDADADADADPGAPARAAERLAGLLADARSARRVGRVYLHDTPAERDPEVLVALLAASLAVDARAIARTDDATLRRLIERRVRRDFADGRTTSVDGWVLSVTEARLSAMSAVTALAVVA